MTDKLLNAEYEYNPSNRRGASEAHIHREQLEGADKLSTYQRVRKYLISDI
jgi:hypothetical protein